MAGETITPEQLEEERAGIEMQGDRGLRTYYDGLRFFGDIQCVFTLAHIIDTAKRIEVTNDRFDPENPNGDYQTFRAAGQIMSAGMRHYNLCRLVEEERREAEEMWRQQILALLPKDEGLE